MQKSSASFLPDAVAGHAQFAAYFFHQPSQLPFKVLDKLFSFKYNNSKNKPQGKILNNEQPATSGQFTHSL